MKTLATMEKTATIEIVEKPSSWKQRLNFKAFTEGKAKDMVYGYVNRVAKAKNYYHHKPEIFQQGDRWVGSVIIYGNITVINGDGTRLYDTEGIDPPTETVIEEKAPPGITIKTEEKPQAQVTPEPETTDLKDFPAIMDEARKRKEDNIRKSQERKNKKKGLAPVNTVEETGYPCHECGKMCGTQALRDTHLITHAQANIKELGHTTKNQQKKGQ